VARVRIGGECVLDYEERFLLAGHVVRRPGGRIGCPVGGVLAPKSLSWMLVSRVDATAPDAIPTRRVLTAVARRGLPNIVEATLIPTILFLVVGATIGTGAAIVAVLVWGYGAVARRLVLHSRVPALLLLATFGLTVRTAVGLASGSTFAYFVQPVATTVALAALFAGSVLVGRPLIGRLAHDFVPLDPEVAGRPAVVQLFAGLTLLWAGVHLATAATTFSLLVTLPVPLFVALKTVACACITVAAIAVTVVMSLRTARREQLVLQEA
jgi:hypothetical protein